MRLNNRTQNRALPAIILVGAWVATSACASEDSRTTSTTESGLENSSITAPQENGKADDPGAPREDKACLDSNVYNASRTPLPVGVLISTGEIAEGPSADLSTPGWCTDIAGQQGTWRARPTFPVLASGVDVNFCTFVWDSTASPDTSTLKSTLQAIFTDQELSSLSPDCSCPDGTCTHPTHQETRPGVQFPLGAVSCHRCVPGLIKNKMLHVSLPADMITAQPSGLTLTISNIPVYVRAEQPGGVSSFSYAFSADRSFKDAIVAVDPGWLGDPR